MSRGAFILVVTFLLVIGGYILWQSFGSQTPVQLSKNCDGDMVVKTKSSTADDAKPETIASSTDNFSSNPSPDNKKIMVTNDVRHNIPLDEIVGGGPPKDGIPPIDNPKFVSVEEACKWLKDEEPGVAVSIGGVERFYPYQILVWHEIVNDTIAGRRILVTYCPLCYTGIVFDPLVQGERVQFGTSGKLWNSNLVMYDRKTESYWSQILGEAIVGEETGTRLAVLPSDLMRFGTWKKLNPDGEVLSRDTGARRFYGQDPYGDYYTTPGIYFNVNKRDDRLPEKEFVLGILVNGKAKAYPTEAVKKAVKIEDGFEGKTIIAEYDTELDAVRLFEKMDDGTLMRVNPFGAFWFSWVAAHPDTELYK